MLRTIAPDQAEDLCKSMVIPPKPAILLALDRARQHEEPDFELIGHLIASDMTLSAAVLKTVNSPLFQLDTRIASIHHALQLLGLDNVCRIVQGIAMMQAVRGPAGKVMEQFWESSQKIATLSAFLSTRVHGIRQEEAYTFGLFHNCGQPLMAARFPDYRQLLQKGERMARKEFIEQETLRFQTNHAVVGYLLARTWYLPETTCLAILNHHDYSVLDAPEDNEWAHACTLIALASLAEHIHKMFVRQFEHVEWRAIEGKLLSHLALELEEFEDLLDQAHNLLGDN